MGGGAGGQGRGWPGGGSGSAGEVARCLFSGGCGRSLCCRVFYGATTEETILREIRLLGELLGSPASVLRDRYMVAAYENPSVPQRRNEIWFIRRAE